MLEESVSPCSSIMAGSPGYLSGGTTECSDLALAMAERLLNEGDENERGGVKGRWVILLKDYLREKNTIVQRGDRFWIQSPLVFNPTEFLDFMRNYISQLKENI